MYTHTHTGTAKENAHCIPPMVYITEMMCFSSSPLITVSHTLLPGPPQRKLNAASSVWYPHEHTFCEPLLLLRYCWADVVSQTAAASAAPERSGWRPYISSLFLFFLLPLPVSFLLLPHNHNGLAFQLPCASGGKQAGAPFFFPPFRQTCATGARISVSQKKAPSSLNAPPNKSPLASLAARHWSPALFSFLIAKPINNMLQKINGFFFHSNEHPLMPAWPNDTGEGNSLC